MQRHCVVVEWQCSPFLVKRTVHAWHWLMVLLFQSTCLAALGAGDNKKCLMLVEDETGGGGFSRCSHWTVRDKAKLAGLLITVECNFQNITCSFKSFNYSFIQSQLLNTWFFYQIFLSIENQMLIRSNKFFLGGGNIRYYFIKQVSKNE